MRIIKLVGMYLLLMIPASIYANSGTVGKFSLEFKYGSAFSYPGFDPSDISSSYFPNKPDLGNTTDNIGANTYTTGSHSEMTRNYILAQNAPDTQLKNREYEILFAYAVSENSSLGFSLNRNAIDAVNMGYGNAIFSIGYIYNLINNNPLNLTDSEVNALEGVFPYYRESLRNFRDFRTINLNYTYSFATSAKVVPYVRLEIGGGRDQKGHNKAYRAGAGIGARVYIQGQNYASVELVGANYDVYRKSEFLWSLMEYSMKVGIGRRF